MIAKKLSKVSPRYVLLIEDNALHAELVTEILDAHCGPVIVHAVDAFHDAVEFLRQNDYHCVVTSAKVNDELLLEWIGRLIRFVGKTPIVAIAGSGNEREAAELIKRGVRDYLVKTRESLEHLPGILKRHILTAKPALRRHRQGVLQMK